ncbi:MAG TPA: N-acetylmuramoyl-L-alanine amidase [Anaerolineales bacterium]|nr:N-acetylmuramoyl-L-alanine amidase [Anaerolineales bacterium]
MENSTTSPGKSTIVGVLRSTFTMLSIVFVAAVVLATLFTGGASPDQLENTGAQFFAFQDPFPAPSLEPQAAAVEATGTPAARQTPRIGIVAGHWGNDSGAVCPDGLTEVELNQNIAVLVQKYLIARGLDVDVLQEFDPLLTGYKADALISVHADSCEFSANEPSGYKVASALATKRPEESARLTACLRNRYAQATDLALHSTSMTPDMTYYHAFEEVYVDTPAAIIETGFMNADRDLLENNPERAALGIAEGVLCFLNQEAINLPIPTAAP